MNKIDKPHSFTVDACARPRGQRAAARARVASSNPTAMQIARGQGNRRDTMSPVMVSGTLRLVEFAAAASGGCRRQPLVCRRTNGTQFQYLVTILSGGRHRRAALGDQRRISDVLPAPSQAKTSAGSSSSGPARWR